MGERTPLPSGIIVKVIETITDEDFRKLKSFILSNTGSGEGRLKEIVPPDLFRPKGAFETVEAIVAETEGGKIVGCVGLNPEPGHPHNVFGLVTAEELGERRYLLGHVLLAHALKRARELGLEEIRVTPIRRALPFFTGISADPVHVYRELEARVRLWRRTGNVDYLNLGLIPEELRRELLVHGIRTLNAERRPTPFSRLDDANPVHVFRSGVRSFTLVSRYRGVNDHG